MFWQSLSALTTWSGPTACGSKRRLWVGIIVRDRRLISNCTGDIPISWKGVLRYLSNPSNESLWSAAAFIRIRFAFCTALSAAPFDWGYSGELVVWWNPHSWANSLNSCVLSNKFLVLLYCELLSLTTSSEIPNLANVFFRLLITQMTVFWWSSSVSKYFE